MDCDIKCVLICNGEESFFIKIYAHECLLGGVSNDQKNNILEILFNTLRDYNGFPCNQPTNQRLECFTNTQQKLLF